MCKITKKLQKIRHFDRALTFASAGISAFWHFSTKNEEKFVQNYLLTFSRICVIINTESEGTTMKKGDIYYVDLSPVVGNELGGVRMCQIVEVYAEENLVRVIPIARDPKTNSYIFREIHERTVSTKRLKEFIKNS